MEPGHHVRKTLPFLAWCPLSHSSCDEQGRQWLHAALRTLEIDEGEPYRFEVIGLPAGRGAMLARLSGVWKILKIERGKSHAWTGSFISADDALTSLAGDV
jgi:hypothetical protein